jgi:hypothetical protein
MIVAVSALIIALAGTAMAAPTAIKSILNKKEKKQVKNISNNQINALAPGLSVKHAGTADTAKDANSVGGTELKNIVTGRSVNPGGPACDPSSTTFINCASVDLTLPHEGRVLLIGTAGQVAFNNAQTQGDCLFRVDGVNSGGSVHVGNQYAPTPTGATSVQFPNGFANTAVVGPIAAGLHTFALACSEATSDIEFVGPQLSAVLLGSG